MIICGVNVTHDGGIAVIADNRLLFSVEIEKLGNGRRYSALGEFDRIAEILRSEGVNPSEVDRYVLNGWYSEDEATAPNVAARQNGQSLQVPVAPYTDFGSAVPPLHRHLFGGIRDTCLGNGYASYAHATTHVLAAYCSSPYADSLQDALVLAWDGGMLPRLYEVRLGRVRYLGPLFPLMGNVFAEFSSALEPFRCDGQASGPDILQHHLEVPGKAMAYAALGKVQSAAFAVFDSILVGQTDAALRPNLGGMIAERSQVSLRDLSSADLIATFQAYIGKLLVDGFRRVLLRRFQGRSQMLCISGGCALNIKWNTILRESGLFSGIWIPPFPNDSGAAIGSACCEMVHQSSRFCLDWSVFSGPSVDLTRIPETWIAQACDEPKVAALLHTEGEPVLVLDGRAELGPRALGNRSILAPAIDAGMKERLNVIKGRANYRPVAPICLESQAEMVFAPGTPDPYMLFEHRLRTEWIRRLPAIIHLDGSARLQTIDPDRTPTATAKILRAYATLSGIPVLCNTSANMPGRGFFPDPASAACWGRIKYVWSRGVLYSNPHHEMYRSLPT